MSISPQTKSVIKKSANRLKSISREIILGVVIGIIILALTPVMERLYANRIEEKTIKETLSCIRIGMSKAHIDEMFGSPMVEFEKIIRTNESDNQYNVNNYKLKDCVLSCIYNKNSIIAFGITVNDKDVYNVPRNMYLGDSQSLLSFTYSDFSDTVDYLYGNAPADNDDGAYYYEIHYGHNPADFNYYIIGNYKDYSQQHSNNLYFIGQKDIFERTSKNSSISNYFSSKEMEEMNKYRNVIKPNFYGMISHEYIDEFNFSDFFGSSSSCGLLFDDWIR